jgi:HSP20 family protein
METPQQHGLGRERGREVFLPTAAADFFRMSPFSLMRRMSEEMDRALRDFRRGPEGEETWAPAIEVSQREGNYVIRAEIPGVNPSDVKLEVTDEAVILQGERKSEHEETKGGVHMSERHYGRFYRAIPLPEGAKGEEARARFDNGVLDVTVPLGEQHGKRREIPIQAGAPGKPA